MKDKQMELIKTKTIPEFRYSTEEFKKIVHKVIQDYFDGTQIVKDDLIKCRTHRSGKQETYFCDYPTIDSSERVRFEITYDYFADKLKYAIFDKKWGTTNKTIKDYRQSQIKNKHDGRKSISFSIATKNKLNLLAEKMGITANQLVIKFVEKGLKENGL